MTHLDLFSGIGGFAYAADRVWEDVGHIFCDNEPFAQKVIAKHWPGSRIYGDIKDITKPGRADLVTGGFPCQPFSHAGRKKGTEDGRYLWPEMYRVIKLAKPEWVLAENVLGISTWGSGVVLEQVCTDLEATGYKVQPLIIPAIAVNAPHRRDRVWFVARNPKHARQHGSKDGQGDTQGADGNTERPDEPKQPAGPDSLRAEPSPGWDSDWHDIATRLCRVDDGLPDRVDRIKALGNAIVPQVAIEIMKGMV